MTKDELIEIACAAFHDGAFLERITQPITKPGSPPLIGEEHTYQSWRHIAPNTQDIYRNGMRAALEAMAKATKPERDERMAVFQNPSRSRESAAAYNVVLSDRIEKGLRETPQGN